MLLIEHAGNVNKSTELTYLLLRDTTKDDSNSIAHPVDSFLSYKRKFD